MFGWLYNFSVLLLDSYFQMALLRNKNLLVTTKGYSILILEQLWSSVAKFPCNLKMNALYPGGGHDLAELLAST